MDCSKGTYIRALARDLGKLAGSCAYVQSLRRTRIGPYTVSEAVVPEIFSGRDNLLGSRELLARLDGIGICTVRDESAAGVRNGRVLQDRFFTAAPDKDGLLAATNHFVDPSWKIPPPANDEQNAWTVKRRQNLLALAETYKGQFDIDKMKQVLDTTIDNGGATQPNETIYQIIAVPRDLILWLKAPGKFDWQKIDLSKLFNNRA